MAIRCELVHEGVRIALHRVIVEVADQPLSVGLVGLVDASPNNPVTTERPECIGRGELGEPREQTEPQSLCKCIAEQPERIRDLLPLVGPQPRGEQVFVRATEPERHYAALGMKWIAVFVTVPNVGTSLAAIAVSLAGTVTATRNTSPGKGEATVDSISDLYT